jgi:hypothetical protein
MTKKTNKKNRLRNLVISAIVVAAVVIAYAVPGLIERSSALWNDETAVHIDPSTIENGTLIIGTHLVHISALTDDIYEMAIESAGESSQSRIYYKSELNDGAWCDITEANSLAAISSGYTDPTGMQPPVVASNDDIAALFFEYHTKSDGITYDLRTNAAVNIFDTSNPYDLESMTELEPLKMQYDLYTNSQADTDDGEERIDRIDKFWATNVRSAVTDRADQNMSALQQYFQIISQEEEAKDQMSAVQGVMGAVDATRRADVFSTVDQALGGFIEEIAGYTEGGLTDADLKSALNDSLANVQVSLSEQEGKRLDAGVTVLSSVRFDASNSLISNAAAQNYAACDKDVSTLTDLSNIENGSILNQASEAELLNTTLIPNATNRLTQGLEAGENAQYKAAVSANSAGATLRGIASDNRSTLNSSRGELESFITAYTKRIVAEDSITFIDERIDMTTSWLGQIPNDAFLSDAETCVNSHIEFLSTLKRQIEIALGGSELDQLTEEKAALQTDYLAALDDNDLTGAKAAQDQIADLDAKIAAVESETNAQISDLEQQIADLQAQINQTSDADALAALQRALDLLKAQLRALSATLSPNSVGSLASSLRSSALGIIENGGNLTDLDNAIASLGEMMDLNFKVIFPALKDLYDAMQKKYALEGNTAYADQIKAVEALIINNQSAYDASLAGGKSDSDIGDIVGDYFDNAAADGAGLGAGTDTGTTGSGLGSAGTGSLSGKGAIAYINALKEYAAATGSDTATQLMKAEAQKQLGLGNKLVYKQFDNPSVQYLPVTAVSYWCGLRYVWNRNLSEATLTRGTDYYAFTMWSDTVVRSRNKADSDKMDAITGFLGAIYIPGSYTAATFECEPVYLPDSDLGILMSKDIQDTSDEILALLMQ